MKNRERAIVTSIFAVLVLGWLGFLLHVSPRFAGSGIGAVFGISGAALMLDQTYLPANVAIDPHLHRNCGSAARAYSHWAQIYEPGRHRAHGDDAARRRDRICAALSDSFRKRRFEGQAPSPADCARRSRQCMGHLGKICCGKEGSYTSAFADCRPGFHRAVACPG